MSIISLITGNDQPVGEEWVDDRVEQAKRLAQAAVEKVKVWSADDPDTWTDDALRWVGGAIKNTGNWWQESTAEQEGIRDDILRAVGWTGGKALQVLDAGSYYGGKLGGKVAEFIGVDARIGGFAGNVIGDLALTGAFAKVGQSAKAYNRIKRLKRLGATDLQIQDLFTRKHAFAYGELPDMHSDVRLALTGPSDAGERLLKNLTAVDANGNYVNPVARLPGAEGKGTRTGGADKFSKAKIASQFVEDKRAFNAARDIQKTGAPAWQKELKWMETHGTTTPWQHHHIIDHDIAGQAYNRVDAAEIDRILKEKGIRLGDDEANIISAASYNDPRLAWQEEILKQRRDLDPNVKADKRLLDDLTKTAQYDEFGELIPPNIEGRYSYGLGPEQYSGQLYVNRLRTQGIDSVQMQIDPKHVILGDDHTGIIHEAYKKLESNKRLRAAFESGEYWHWPPEKAAAALIELHRDQRNISVNVAKWRLNLIKQEMGLGKANGLKFTPNSTYKQLRAGILRSGDFIINWIAENPQKAANLNWLKKAPDVEELRRTKPAITKELRQVFTYRGI